MDKIICPLCENDNSIQRVSAVVAGGTSTGSFAGPTGAITYSDGKVGSAGGYTTISGGTSTAIAKTLGLPKEPQVKDNIIAIVLLLFGILLVGGEVSANAGGCLGTPGAFLILIPALWIMSNNETNKRVRSIDKPNWEFFKKKWEQLYYCHKHGIVFDPETNKTCDPTQINNFVNELIKDQLIKPETSGTGA